MSETSNLVILITSILSSIASLLVARRVIKKFIIELHEMRGKGMSTLEYTIGLGNERVDLIGIIAMWFVISTYAACGSGTALIQQLLF